MVSHQCIQSDVFKKSIKFSKCDETIKEQKWKFTEFTNEATLRDWKSFGRPLEDNESYE